MKPDSFKDFVLDQLGELQELECRAMFGGHGLYSGDTFFGILFKGRLYFKTTGATRREYVERGMKPFQPGKKQTLQNYYEVPAEVIESRELLTVWARQGAGEKIHDRKCRE